MLDIKLLLDTRDVNLHQWEQFVDKHPHGNVFQTYEMYKVYENSKNHEPILLITVDEHSEISGILLAVVLKEYSGFKGNITARSIIQGGPLIRDDNPDIMMFIIQQYDKIIKKKSNLYSV